MPPAAGIAIPITVTLVHSAVTASLLWRRNYEPEQEVSGVCPAAAIFSVSLESLRLSKLQV